MFLFVMSYVMMPYGNTVYNCCFGVGLSHATLSAYKYLIE